MKKIRIMLMMFALLLTGCSTSSQKEEIKVLTPNGAPALSLLSVYKDVNEKGEIKIVEGSDLISSELVKKESSYDIIIAPINLGCQLLNKGKTDYKLAGVITWGNLYLVENPSAKTDKVVAFGEQAVPGKMLNLTKKSIDFIKDKDVQFYNAVSDVQPQIINGNVRYALMAEPAATVTIAKAKQNNVNLKIVADLQDIYQKQEKTKVQGYPQAAIFVKDKKKVQNILSQVDTFTNQEALQDNNQIVTMVNEIGVQTFGVPNAEIALKTWEKQNIHYKDAIDVKEDIQSLLKQFGITLSDDMLAS
ncbi:MAG: hypothetical protein HFF37_04685 [Coprobacillus sp.]|nr:hypothetical protein [Coprobacillus sp.]